jgi:imidazolonepropionase-like amidohydrolase
VLKGLKMLNVLKTLAVLAAIALVVRAPSLVGQEKPAARRGPVVIRNATILTVTKGTIRNGSVLLRDGKIVAAGASVDTPAGAEVYDAGGRFVTPGLIDAHSHIAADSINEGGTTVSSMTGIEEVLDPTDIDIYRDLAGGLTTANVLHGSANPIGGRNAVIKLRWGKTRAKDLRFEDAMPGIKFALGENPKDIRTQARPGGQAPPRRYPVTRAGVEYVIRDAFMRAKAYQAAWREHEQKKKTGARDAVPPRRDLQLEPLVEILEGKRLVHAHCYRADEILMLLRLAEDFGFKIATLQHVLEGYKVAREIAQHGAGASTFSDWWGYKIEAVDAIPHNAALMTRKGVLASINSDSAELARRLNTEAAKSVKWGGLNDDEALALVTINPAKQLRIDQRVGSIEPGKDADVVVWTHHPLSSYAIVDRVYIDGDLYYERGAEERRLTEHRKEKDALLSAERTRQREQRDRRTPAGGSDEKGVADKVDRNLGGAAPGGTAGSRPGAPPAPADVESRRGTSGTASPPRASAQLRADDARRDVRYPVNPPRGTLAIVNARIHPVTAATIEHGTIVIRDGKIVALGSNIEVPAGAKTIDAVGGDVYPGWINARSTLGLAEPGARGYDDVDEMLDFNPQLRTMVSFHPDSDAIPVGRANGITTVAATPAGGLLGGQVAVMNLDGWTWEEAAVRPSAGIAFQFPTIGRAGGSFFGGQDPERERTYEDLKKERDAKLDSVARLLDQARSYAKANPAERPSDAVLEALVPLVSGEVPLLTVASREQDIRDAVAFADRVKARIVISNGIEAPLVASLLKDKGIPVILGPVLTLPAREDAHHAASYRAAAALAEAGVKFAFATGDANYVRNLPYHAAMSVAWGLPRDEAIKALTINAAEILGVADRLGSLEPGKIANLFVAAGDPLEIRTPIRHVIINGRDVPLTNKHEQLYERYSQRPGVTP